jgi:hypothetical protein
MPVPSNDPGSRKQWPVCVMRAVILCEPARAASSGDSHVLGSRPFSIGTAETCLSGIH